MGLSADDYVNADARTLAARVRVREVTPDDLLDAALARVEKLGETLGAICFLSPERAREAAKEVDLAGPFAGVPFLVKDLGAPLKGTPNVVGCRHLAEHAEPSPFDGELIARFRAAGLVPFGKTTVPEFGLNLATEPAIGPTCRNPWDLARIPGGSSGGAAAAVAAGIVPIAHATDGGGSIRVPAACCGLVGLKPSRGAIPLGPDYVNVFVGLANELVVSRTVGDTALALQVATQPPVAGPCPPPLPDGINLASLDRPPHRLRIGLITAPPRGGTVASAWKNAAESVAAILADAGHAVVPLPPERLEALCATAARMFCFAVCLNMAAGAETLRPGPDGFEPMSFAAARRGSRMTPAGIVAAERDIARVSADLANLFTEIDVILSPSLATSPPPLGSFPTDGDDLDAHLDRFEAFAPFAAMANAGGIPAVAVPHGRDEAGLSTGVQLAGPMGSELRLLRLARHLEMAAPWQQLAPLATEGLAPENVP